MFCWGLESFKRNPNDLKMFLKAAETSKYLLLCSAEERSHVR